MRLRAGSAILLLLASCMPAARNTAPVPVPTEVVAAPVLVPVSPPALETLGSRDTTLAQRATDDSLVLTRQARDSALDASVLDALDAVELPDSAVTDSETAWRDMFDIDVANWMDHHRVKYYLDFFSGPARERMSIWLERMPHYEPTIRAKLIARGLPGDLAYLPLIESGYSVSAVSRSKAVGMWQFMRGTARLYGLQVDGWVDERRDVSKATEAAIHFLADLTAKFGSPYLAAAAYNGGPGRIQRGLARIEGYEVAAADDIDDDDGGPQAGDAAFFQLADTRHIMRETKDYVPKLIAAAMIAKRPEMYGFDPIATDRFVPADSVVVQDATGLDVIADAAGVSMTELWTANPMYLRAVTPPKRAAVVRVPPGRGTEAQAKLDALPASARLSPVLHHVKRGETTATIAKRYGLGISDLRDLNPMLKSRAPRSGEVLTIPGRVRLSGWVSENRRVVGESDGASGGSTHRVRRGETLSELGRRYRVRVAELRAWNHLGPSSLIRVGQVLRVRPRAVSASSDRVRGPSS